MSNEGINQKQGVINKCPSCGGALKAFASTCELCGHELAGVSANRTVTELSARFAEIEAEVDQSGLTGRKREAEIESRKGRLIRDFPIPNSREDLQSLIHFIHPKIQNNLKPDPNMEDWRMKFKEVMALAKNAYKGDSKTRAEFEELERSLNSTLSGDLKSSARRNPMIAIGIGLVGIAVIVGLTITQMDKRAQTQCLERYEKGSLAENARLEGIVTAINAKQKNGDSGQAVADLAALHWNYKEESCKQDAAQQEEARWESRKKDLSTQLKEAQSQAQQVLTEQEAQKKAEASRQEAEKADSQAKQAAGQSKAATNKEW